MAPILIKYRLALQTLSRYLMDFHSMLKEPNTHPRNAFLLIQRFVGELTSFTPKVSVLSVDVNDHALAMEYDHFDMAPAFRELLKLSKTLLDEIVVSEDLNISMSNENEAVFSVVLPENFFRINNRFYVVVITQEDPKNWWNDFANFARIASVTRLRELVRRSLPGLNFRRISETPPGLPNRRNAHYFLLEQSGAVWEEIYNSRSLAINWDNAPEGVKIDVSVVEG